MEPIDYLRALRRRWLVVVACVGVALVVGVVTLPPAQAGPAPSSTSYSATYTMILSPDATGINLNRVKLLITTGDIPRAVAAAVDFPGNAAELPGLIAVAADPDIGTITITMNDSDPDKSARYANAFGNQTLLTLRAAAIQKQKDQLRALQPLLDGAEAAVQTLENKVDPEKPDNVLQAQLNAQTARYQSYFQQYETVRAEAPTGDFSRLDKAVAIPQASGGSFTPPSSRHGRLLFAAVLGLVLGLTGAVALDRLDTRLRGRQSFETAFRLPVLAEIPHVPGRGRRRNQFVVLSDPSSAAAEAYRSLRAGLMLLPSLLLPRSSPLSAEAALDSARPEVILVASGSPREGKTTTLVNLATCLAEVGKNVLILDCDFRRPDAHRYLDVSPGKGISDLLVTGRAAEISAVVRHTNVPGVHLVHSGSVSEHPAAFLAGMGSIITAARPLADVVLIDSAPLLGASDAVDLMPFVDSLLVIARFGKTGRAEAERVSALIARMQIPALGVAVVGTTRRRVRTSGGVPDLPNLFRRQSSRWRSGTMRADESARSDSVAHSE